MSKVFLFWFIQVRIQSGAVRNSYQLLSDMGMDKLALELEKIYNELFKEHFTVAVVGEFNRGKSTFVNRILKKNVVPEGILPTTSLLTRIRYAEKDILEIYDNQDQQIKKTSLTLEEWDGFMAGNFDTGEFEGVAIAGVRSDWLAKTGIEFVDTPGAGDLEEARIKVIEEALLGCDGAIIAVNATQALSLSEQLFIKERLIMKKILIC